MQTCDQGHEMCVFVHVGSYLPCQRVEVAFRSQLVWLCRALPQL